MAKYLKQDSDLGYIENSAEIEYLKLNNLRHSILGFMLGDFDEQGFYTISTEIQKELLSMRKFIVNSVDNIDICHGTVMLDKPITFMVTFESDRATLSLVEKISFEANTAINSGAYSNVNEFVLDEVETAGEINRNLVYKRWNIGEFGGEVLGVNSMDATTLALYSGLVNRYKYLLAANKLLLEKEEQLEDIEAEYTLGIVEILSRYPALKAVVEEEVKTQIKDKTKFLRLDKPNFAKTFNEILDQSLENNLSVLDGSELNMFSQERREVIQNRNMRMLGELDVKTQIAEEEESNQTELDEEFGTRSDRKLVIDAGSTAGRSIGELETEFNEAEKSVTDLIIGATLALLAGKKASEAKRYNKFRLGVIEYITKTTTVPPREFTNEDMRHKLDEIEKAAKAAHGVASAAAAPEQKTQAQNAAAKANKGQAQKGPNKADKAAGASGPRPNNATPAAGKTKDAEPNSPTPATEKPGIISRLGGNTNGTRVDLGRASGTLYRPAKQQPRGTSLSPEDAILDKRTQELKNGLSPVKTNPNINNVTVRPNTPQVGIDVHGINL